MQVPPHYWSACKTNKLTVVDTIRIHASQWSILWLVSSHLSLLNKHIIKLSASALIPLHMNLAYAETGLMKVSVKPCFHPPWDSSIT